MTSDTQMDTAIIGPTRRRESHLTNKPRQKRHTTANSSKTKVHKKGKPRHRHTVERLNQSYREAVGATGEEGPTIVTGQSKKSPI